jgi:penicillin-binding protein 1C
VPGLIGRVAAAPILFDAFARTGRQPVALPKAPKGAVMVVGNEKLPLPLRRFRPIGELVRAGNEQAPHIQFPLNGSRIDVDRTSGADAAMPVKVAGGVLPMNVVVNGVSAGEIDGRRQGLIDPPGPGFARLTVIDATGAADTVVIRVQ